MKNFKKLFTFLLAISIVFTACNKDTSLTKVKNIDPTEQKILNFKEKMKNPNKSDEAMSIDSAVWYVEAALNYTHCNSEISEVIGVDSVFVTINVTNNQINFNDIIVAYNQLNADLINVIGDNAMRVADVEFVENNNKNNEQVFKLTVVNGKVIPMPFADLNQDWLPGPGGCYMGRCDGTHLDKSAATVWSNAITISKGVPANGYFTDVSPVEYFGNADNLNHTELDTMLFKGYFETIPCISSTDMHKYYDRGRIIANRYNPPAGWGVSYVKYHTVYGGLPGKIWSSLVVFGGEIHYSNPSEL